MKKLVKYVSTFLLLACSTGPKPINFGTDNCDYCKMSISDQKFGAEIVSKKGKILKFDSDECMRDYIKEHSNALTEAENVYVIDYSHPATLINGKTAVFLHGPKVKSPMGGHLAAFANKADATIQQGTLGGDIITWDQMLATE